ncbi:MAG: hypothetical protein Q9187_006951 [Circinaria calcarea]
MDDKYAYKTGDYTSQISAMDANHFALEGCGANGFTLWVYMAKNNHQWGDLWNGEDLSIFSVDDKPLPLRLESDPATNKSASTSTASLNHSSPSYSQSQTSSPDTLVDPKNLQTTLSTPSISSTQTGTSADLTSHPGYRAAEAYVRPSPIATVGNVTSYGFDLRNATFTLLLTCDKPATEDTPTEVFLPEVHFPREGSEVDVSGGKWTIGVDDGEGGLIQKLKWWHGIGEQRLTVKGIKRRQGTAVGNEEEEGYLEQCQQNRCGVM